MAKNGETYQKFDGNTGTYQEVPDANGHSTPTGGARKWVIGAVLLAVLGVVYVTTGHHSSSAAATNAVDKSIASSTNIAIAKNGKLKLFDSMNRYVLEDFDAKSSWSSFLPGVAGYFGKPVWVFYVNRGQGIATFGTESKDYPILEFNPANKAYQMTPYWGFRTFLRGTRGDTAGTSFQSEPFSPATSRNPDDPDDDAAKPKRILFVGTNEMEIQEIDGANGVTTNVQYFVMPDEDYAALVRRTTFTNTGDDTLVLDALDGLAKMEPFGGRLDWGLKSMGRTLEGWMGVYHADDTLSMPFYKLSTEPSDSAAVKIEEAGNYCLTFIESGDGKSKLLPVVFDTNKIFGRDTTLTAPKGLDASSVGDILEHPQYGFAKTSSAFAALNKFTLAPGETVTISSIYGKADHIDKVPEIAETVTAPGYIVEKMNRAREITSDLAAGVECHTASPLFDGTVEQMFLDNGLRGGIPTILGNVDSDATYDEDPGVKVFHTFSRIHGDLERDYNAFSIEPQYFSQGPGNYRDVAQNRRNDVTFFPRMGSFNIQLFLGYIQADGYEPLTVEAVVFRFQDEDLARSIATEVTADAKSAEVLGNVISDGPFRPGQLFMLCEELNIVRAPDISEAEFLNKILAGAEDRAMAVYGQGYWADHWDYYIDIINAYLAVFPDVEEEVMYDKQLRYFFSTATVKPRAEKYVLEMTYDGTSHHVLQLDATYFDKDKADEQEDFRSDNTGLLGIEASWQRTKEGQPFMSSAIAKLLLLGSLKFAMRDAWGMGIEYEGGRPGWLDSMNGLPGMVGSGMPETYELKLLLEYVQKVVDTYGRDVIIPSELAIMITTVNESLETLESAGYTDSDDLPLEVPQPLFDYWDACATAREEYRAKVEYYFSGETVDLSASAVSTMVGKWLEQIDLGIERSFKFATVGYQDDGTSGIPATFFAFDITDWELNGGKNDVGLPTVNAKAMSVKNFPLFLEGPVRYMKIIEDDKERMNDIYDRVKVSGLRDTNLNMYYLSASLQGQGFDMGRQVAFAPGWLENQSIWMHMSYKYYLQLIRGKLYDQFFDEYKGGGILPFMDPDVYGRSLMECSSFIASSAFPDPSIVGEGFLPRLSGSTAEFMDIWKLMFIGPELFFLNEEGKLTMQLQPAIPDWLFEDPEGNTEPKLDEDGNHTVMFKLFASIPVTYHNPGGATLYGKNPKSYKITFESGDVKTIDEPTISRKTAEAIRRMTTVASIDAFF